MWESRRISLRKGKRWVQTPRLGLLRGYLLEQQAHFHKDPGSAAQERQVGSAATRKAQNHFWRHSDFLLNWIAWALGLGSLMGGWGPVKCKQKGKCPLKNKGRRSVWLVFTWILSLGEVHGLETHAYWDRVCMNITVFWEYRLYMETHLKVSMTKKYKWFLIWRGLHSFLMSGQVVAFKPQQLWVAPGPWSFSFYLVGVSVPSMSS